MTRKTYSLTDFSHQTDPVQIDSLGSNEYLDEDINNDAPLQQILGNYRFKDTSLDNIQSVELLATPLAEGMREVFAHHKLSINDTTLLDLIDVVSRNNLPQKSEQKDPLLELIDTTTPLSYWKKECSELFDYPDNMHGYKTSWDFLRGIYNPDKHKTLYYNDLKEINHKLYRAVYRRNNKEKFLPNHSDKIAKEVELMKSKNIKLSDIKDPKVKERYRMRFQHLE